ncbi:MAG TPA: M67 family metallopeptidase [Vicinamibacterales bacterium]|nr:M67 family metallopeptidase [Vicinamibacterales bacterium]
MKIRQQVLDRIVAHAVGDLPNECCGLLIGNAQVVEDAAPARNVRRSRTRFQVEPADHFAAIRRARAAGLDVIGAYHSHPNGPSGPSETDRARLTDPAMFHVIISLAHGTRTVRAFRFADGNFTPLELVPVP